MKAKRGQILIFALVSMAVGLIIISPLLYFLDSSSTQYLHEITRTSAYYTADAMMENILNDIHSGVDVYNQNVSTPYGQSDYLHSGYDINVSINYSVTQPVPTPTGSGDWLYLDPGVTICNASSCDTSLLLGSLATGATHNYSLYLIGGNQVTVNWAINESLPQLCGWLWFILFYYTCCDACPYNCDGSMWMTYQNGSVVPNTSVSGNSSNAPLTLSFTYSVPPGTSGNYTIKFKNNNTYRYVATDLGQCCNSGYINDTAAYTVFGGTGETDHTWVQIGKPVGQGYSYQDYMITATAKDKHGQNIVSITAVVRNSPGPLAWWQEQTVEIPSWQITYYY